ncbi:invasion associated locus B family protein [Mongoliimonas terrestris]|uniref:invasion associated locus B family protein n=1 Tax=Mongoliimonas terrestris TaxID=1709001 RepID=UPI000949AEA6|nr:invasion associated locus B family protein [Mongoliimonas terrestris]
MTNARTLGTALTMLLGAATVAGAQTQTLLEQFNRWTTYAYNGNAGKVCYAITQPQKTEPSGLNRDPAYVFVTNRPKEGVRHEFSVETGYPYKEGSKTTVKIGNDTFVLFTKESGAWVENAAEESRLIAAMRAGSDMVVTGTSRRGTTTTDTYSLSGVTAAVNRIDGECR